MPHTTLDPGSVVGPTPVPLRLEIGDRIDFGDSGEGTITARDGGRVFLQSPVFTGWVPEDYLLGMLSPLDED
jgi:hypothetical protein